VFDRRSRKKKMLAVFEKSVAKSPEALKSPHSDSVSALKGGFLAQHFGSVHPGSVTVNLGSAGLMAYSIDRQNPLLPRLVLQHPFPYIFLHNMKMPTRRK
jgi:hypothetical protein